MSARVSIESSTQGARRGPGRGRARYDELALLLEGRIIGGIYAPGERLPSESELCAEFNLSRVTVRKSVAVLVAAGLVVTRHGQGTFVADPLPRQVASARLPGPTYMGFIDDLRIEGLVAPMKVLDRKEVRPDQDTAERLGIARTEQVVRFRWVRSNEGIPLAYGIDHVTAEVGQRITLSEARSCPSLLDAFERAGTWPTENIQNLTAALASPDVARNLDVDAGSPVVQINGVSFDRGAMPFDAYRLWLSPDYRLQLRFIRVAEPRSNQSRTGDGAR